MTTATAQWPKLGGGNDLQRNATQGREESLGQHDARTAQQGYVARSGGREGEAKSGTEACFIGGKPF